WVLDPSYTLPSDLIIFRTFDNTFFRVYFQDVNGDGLIDIITSGDTYINAGHSWVKYDRWNSGADLYGQSCYWQNPAMFLDANGDGLIDVEQSFSAASGYRFSTTAYFNKTQTPVDLLSLVALPAGGQIAATYKATTQYKDGSGNLLNPSLPLV